MDSLRSTNTFDSRRDPPAKRSPELLSQRMREMTAAAAVATRDAAHPPHIAAGLAEFLHAWGIHADDPAAGQSADRALDLALDGMGRGNQSAWWIGGLSGATWAVRRVLALRGESVAGFSDPVDELLESMLAAPDWYREYDLILGLAGFALYAAGHPDPEWRATLGRHVLRHLEALAREDDDGCYWFTPVTMVPAHQRHEFPEGYRNLGLAHGVAGVIGALARLRDAGVEPARTGSLLRAATAWLLARRRRDPDRGNGAFVFANIADQPDVSRPLAWCYGDLGIALALACSARSLADPELETFSIALALECSKRTGSGSGIQDAGLCHGAAGAALAFHRFACINAHPAFVRARDSWLNAALSMRDERFNESAGVFCVRGGAGQRHADFSVLTGLAGVGLTALACANHDQPGWDAPYLFNLDSQSFGASR